MKILSAILATCCVLSSRVSGENFTFPEGFFFCAGGSAHQIEGAWNVDDKSPSTFDVWTHNNPWEIKDGSNADVACDSYHKYEEDVEMVKDLGLDVYRISISWPRILPKGYGNYVSKSGIQYYRNLLKKMKAEGIEPLVTLYHWNHPQVLEDMGGWMNELMVKWFADYARVVFRELGPMVKMFSTMNEMLRFCSYGYGTDGYTVAPGTPDRDRRGTHGGRFWIQSVSTSLTMQFSTESNNSGLKVLRSVCQGKMDISNSATGSEIGISYPGTSSGYLTSNELLNSQEIKKKINTGKKLGNDGPYLCVHNMLKAHAEAYHIYHDEFRSAQHGVIGAAFDCNGHLPRNASDPDDVEAAERGNQFRCGWAAHPIYSGDYPEVMKKQVALRSQEEGYVESRLPKFSESEIQRIKGTSDYFGLNYYFSFAVTLDPDRRGETVFDDAGVKITNEGDEVTLQGFRSMVRWIKEKYESPKIIITESGISDEGGLDDYERIQFYRSYLSEISKSINEDRCDLVGYCFWSLMDDYEWASGYTLKFGTYSVDFNSPNRTRTAKRSAAWWKEFLSQRELSTV